MGESCRKVLIEKPPRGSYTLFGGFCSYGGDPVKAKRAKRKFRPILNAVVKGYSRPLMGDDELATVSHLEA